jgi:nucleolar pre-ribosomal-associated protein 1
LFLDSFSDAEANNVSATATLKDFLASQKPANEDDNETVFLPDLMQAWSFASETNDDKLLSAVPAVLALLLRTLSNILDLSEYGLRLARTILLKKQQELLSRGLTSSAGKEFVISPSLRLLREITIFDGGILAKQVFRGRDQTLKGLARNLGLRLKSAAVEDLRRPSVRTNALRFLLALIKFLPSDAKRDLLNQRDIVASLTRDIKDDPPFIIRDILETLKTYVLLDEALPREAKTRIVNGTSLGRISALYRYDRPEELITLDSKPVDEVAHEFLVLACTSLNAGVLIRQSGFYPRGVDPDDTNDVDMENTFIDLGLDNIEWMDKFTDNVPVRNTILSEFIQTLRPWHSTKQGELLLSILKAAPELFADYFYGKKDFSFDPKLTATWMGYSAFIFCALQLPVPAYFGHSGKYPRLPPPIAIVLENILPQPLSQKDLTRCLTQPNQNLITFFAVRIMYIALNKLQTVLKMYEEAASGHSSIWTQAAEELVDGFCQRFPLIRDVIVAFRRMKITDLMQREVVTKLLVLYYKLVPRIALDAKFGVSAALAETLQALEETILNPQERALRSIELESLFEFAHYSPAMRWFSKIEGLSVSPFVAMLQLCAEAPAGLPLLKIRQVLRSVVEENQILQTQTVISALDSIVMRLAEIDPRDASTIYTFLDDCISRCATKPMKYILALEELRPNAKDEHSLSLLSLAITEQWPFLVKSVDDVQLQGVAKFIARYIAASVKIKEDKKSIQHIVEKLVEATSTNPAAQKVIKRSRKLIEDVEVPEPETKTSTAMSTAESKTIVEEDKSTILATMSGDFEPPAEDHKPLTRWTTKEVDEVIEEGHASALIMLLSSEHLSIRKEAVTNISKFAMKLKESNFDEKEQIWLLLLETVETAKLLIEKEPLPTIITAFASHAIGVLKDPLHCLYGKINKFLSDGPTWKLDRIPLMHKVFNEQPSLDDSHYSEVNWLLSCLIFGLRTPADMALYRNRRVFENLLSTYNSTNLAPGIRDKILRILCRACAIEGGSTTLITRFSTMTWLQAQVALGGGMPLKVLMEKILDSSDKKRIKVWSKGSGKVKKDTLNFKGSR